MKENNNGTTRKFYGNAIHPIPEKGIQHTGMD